MPRNSSASATVPSLKTTLLTSPSASRFTLKALIIETSTPLPLVSVRTTLSLSPSSTPACSRIAFWSRFIVFITVVFSPSVILTVLVRAVTESAAERHTAPITEKTAILTILPVALLVVFFSLFAT